MNQDGKFSSLFVLFLVAGFMFPGFLYKSVSLVLQQANNPGFTGSSRTRRSVESPTNSSRPIEKMGLSLPCLKPSIDDFPGDFMNQNQRKHGGVIVHFLLALYTFLGLTILCNDYFVPSVEEIATKLHIHPNVAGATVMAAGTSGTELFTSLIGVFITKTDIGLATVAGSSSFNVLFIVAICGLFSNNTLPLSRWPLLRDNLCYLLSIAALLAVTYDKRVYWYEALALLCIYVMYVIVMYFDKVLADVFHRLASAEGEVRDIETELTKSEKTKLLPERHKEVEIQFSGSLAREVTHENNDSPSSVRRKLLSWTSWIIALPFTCLFFVTIPDCRTDRWKKWYPVSFIISFAWMAVICYFLIWMTAIVGFALNIPDAIMGLTFLAAGTGFPDTICSLIVARQGYADMAVSHANGSNMFNILFCLGLPWLLKTTVVDVGSYVAVVNGFGMSFTMICLFATAVIPLIIMVFNKWYLNKLLGIIFLSLYLIFTAGTVVLGMRSNLEMCTS